MKKSLWLLVILLALLLVFTACANDQPAEQPAEETPADTSAETPADTPKETQRLIMATGGTSGTYYAFGGALAQIINAESDYINITVNASGASAENVQLIGAGDVQLAILQNDVMDYAYHGTNTWEGKPVVTNMSTLCSLYPEVCQLIVAADSGISSVADLAGKRISVGDVGSGVETNAMQIMAAYGLSFDDIKMENLSFAESAEAVKDRTIDGFFATSGVPNTAVLDLQTSRDVKLISLDQDKIDSLIAEYPFYAQIDITNADYSFLGADEKIATVAVQATLICPPDMDTELAYDIVKAIFDNAEAITNAHAKGAYLSPDYAVQGVSIDFHPGARQYFEEAGAL